MVEVQQERERLSRPLTKQDKERASAVLEAAARLEKQLKPLGQEQSRIDSSDLLNESREERTQHLS